VAHGIDWQWAKRFAMRLCIRLSVAPALIVLDAWRVVAAMSELLAEPTPYVAAIPFLIRVTV